MPPVHAVDIAERKRTALEFRRDCALPYQSLHGQPVSGTGLALPVGAAPLRPSGAHIGEEVVRRNAILGWMGLSRGFLP